MLHAMLTEAFTAEIDAETAVTRTDPDTELARKAEAQLQQAREHRSFCEKQSHTVHGRLVASRLIEDARQRAEAITSTPVLRTAAPVTPEPTTYVLVDNPSSPEQCGIAFTPQADGTVRVETWEATDGCPESGPSCRTQLHNLTRTEARSWWREARAEGYKRTA